MIASPFLSRARRFLRNERGVAAVELALTAPLMVLMLGLAAAVGEGVAISQKVTATARTLTDLVTHNPTLATSDLTIILNAASATMAPYDTTNLSMVISQVQVDGSGNATVSWSQAAYNGAALKPGAAVTLPAGSFQNSSYYIVGSVAYVYTPFIVSENILGPVTLADQMVFSPRESTSITLK